MPPKKKAHSLKPALARKPAIAGKREKDKKEEDILIPDKLYFRIGEVSRLCRLQAYVLRFWETEFPQLHPVKSSTGQRMYRRRDVETVVKIKDLLYRQGFTIPGARQHLRDEGKALKAQSPLPFPKQTSPDLQRLRAGLQEILEIVTPRR
jgi:DNA-binding transcriptional MerR regulator